MRQTRRFLFAALLVPCIVVVVHGQGTSQERRVTHVMRFSPENSAGAIVFEALAIARKEPALTKIVFEVRTKLGAHADHPEGVRLGEIAFDNLRDLRSKEKPDDMLAAASVGAPMWRRVHSQILTMTAAAGAIPPASVSPAPSPAPSPAAGPSRILVPEGEHWIGITREQVDQRLAECKRLGGTSCETSAYVEFPRHRVILDAFYIDRHKVTNGEFARFAKGGYLTLAEREGESVVFVRDTSMRFVKGAMWRTPVGPGSSIGPDSPVVQVAWQDADRFCRSMGARLPTEAEWEKAVQLTKSTSPGTTSDGVLEWVSDLFSSDYYKQAPTRNPTGPSSGNARVVRGSANSWWLPPDMRTAGRIGLSPNNRSNLIGFRCAAGKPG